MQQKEQQNLQKKQKKQEKLQKRKEQKQQAKISATEKDVQDNKGSKRDREEENDTKENHTNTKYKKYNPLPADFLSKTNTIIDFPPQPQTIQQIGNKADMTSLQNKNKTTKQNDKEDSESDDVAGEGEYVEINWTKFPIPETMRKRMKVENPTRCAICGAELNGTPLTDHLLSKIRILFPPPFLLLLPPPPPSFRYLPSAFLRW